MALLPAVLRRCVYDCAAVQVREMEKARKGEDREDGNRMRAGCNEHRSKGDGRVVEAGLRRGCKRGPVGGRGSYKIQFQGCRFNTTHTAQIFHLLSTFRRYVGIRRAVCGSCNGCARSKWPGMYTAKLRIFLRH